MDRSKILDSVRRRTEPYDIVVIGGGATGAGCALDAASRGFSVLLLEQHDFGKGTSGRSTKLIHGGVRYLRQGNISLVREALKERGILMKNAPHAVRLQPFVIPCYSFFEKAFYGLGMKVYDRLAGKYAIGSSRILTRSETLEHLPGIEPSALSGGVLYYDGQFDDTRFLIDLLRTAHSHGAAVLNYCPATAFRKNANLKIDGVDFIDQETGERFTVSTKCVINATGIFSDAIRGMSESGAQPLLTFAQGIHIVLPRKFLSGTDAVMIPKTSDGRVLFCIPWHDHVIVGTTDTPVAFAELEPLALESEIDFVLETSDKYLVKKPSRADILSVFAGIRPLIRKNTNIKTASLSRGHELFVDDAGLVTITGGKWTTYRRMAEDAVDKAIEIGGLAKVASGTETLPIEPPKAVEPGERLHPTFTYTTADVIRSVRSEMARTIEDVLSRRMRMLPLNAAASIEVAPKVAQIMADEFGKDSVWVNDQLAEFKAVADTYDANRKK